MTPDDRQKLTGQEAQYQPTDPVDDTAQNFYNRRRLAHDLDTPAMHAIMEYDSVGQGQPNVKQEPTQPPERPERETLVSYCMDKASWFLRPLGALQAGAIAPIVKTDYQSDSFIGRTGEALAESGKAMFRELFPTDSERPAYERQVLEQFLPSIPDKLKPAAEMAIAVVSDPAAIAFPFIRSLRKGLEAGAAMRAAKGPAKGPWRAAIEDAVSYVSMQEKDFDGLRKLADKADKGNKNAAAKLMAQVDPDIPEEVIKKADSVLGFEQGPIVEIMEGGADVISFDEYLKRPQIKKMIETGMTTKDELKKKYDAIAGTPDKPAQKAININFAKIQSTDEVTQTISNVAATFSDEINEARRGVQSHEATRQLADTIGMTPELLLKRRRGQAFNAEEALAARRILVSSGEKLAELSRKIAAKGMGADDIDKFAFRKQMAVHYAIQSQVSGMTAEAGRALNAFKVEASSTKNHLKQMDEMMRNMPSGASVEDMAEMMATMDSPQQIGKFVEQAHGATSFDMLMEAWINGLLSGPQTHAVNILSNTLTAVWQVPERAVVAGISKLLGDGAIKGGEPVYQAFGMIEGFKDGLKAFGKSIWTGEAVDAVEKIENAGRRAITAKNIRDGKIGKVIGRAIEEGSFAANAIDLMGEAIRLPGRFLTAEDAFFKSVGYRMELRTLALRKAAEEGLKGEAAAKRMAEILGDPQTLAPDIHMAAIDAGRYQTFTNELGKGGMFDRIAKKIQGANAEAPVLRLVMPFVRTPANIMKFAGERTPLAPFAKSFRDDFRAGGARRDLALARASLGSMVMATVAGYAKAGMITGGGPSDPKMKSLKYNTGWQPYSIKIGDKYYSYSRLEPMGMLFGLAADYAEIAGQMDEKDSEELAAAIVSSVSKNVTSKTWLRGLSEAIRAFDDHERYGERYLQRFAGTVVPTGIAQIEREMSPEMSSINSYLDSIKSRIPGYSKDLPPRRNMWGEPIVLEGGVGPDIMSPIYTSTERHSPIDEELLRMKLPLSMPQKTVGIDTVSIELTPQEYDQFVVFMNNEPLHTGKNLKDSLDEAVQSQEYQSLNEYQRESLIRAFIAEAKMAAKYKLKETNSTIRKLIRYGIEQKQKEMAQ